MALEPTASAAGVASEGLAGSFASYAVRRNPNALLLHGSNIE